MDQGFDDDQDFNSDEVQKIAKAAVEMVVKPSADQNIVYQKDKVNQWSQQIIEACIKDLAKL